MMINIFDQTKGIVILQFELDKNLLIIYWVFPNYLLTIMLLIHVG